VVSAGGPPSGAAAGGWGGCEGGDVWGVTGEGAAAVECVVGGESCGGTAVEQSADKHLLNAFGVCCDLLVIRNVFSINIKSMLRLERGCESQAGLAAEQAERGNGAGRQKRARRCQQSAQAPRFRLVLTRRTPIARHPAQQQLDGGSARLATNSRASVGLKGLQAGRARLLGARFTALRPVVRTGCVPLIA